MKNPLILYAITFVLFSCQKQSFESQIIHDIKNIIPSGICLEFPIGTKLSNITIGEITEIGHEGMTDVSFEFDYKIDGESLKHKKSVLLYIKKENNYVVEEIGLPCDFKKE